CAGFRQIQHRQPAVSQRNSSGCIAPKATCIGAAMSNRLHHCVQTALERRGPGTPEACYATHWEALLRNIRRTWSAPKPTAAVSPALAAAESSGARGVK